MIAIINKHTCTDLPKGSIYIGRGSIFGNPYSHLPENTTKAIYYVNTRNQAIISYKNYMLEMYKTNKIYHDEIDKLVELHKANTDINFVCFCKPKSCHGDLLKEFIEQLSINKLW